MKISATPEERKAATLAALTSIHKKRIAATARLVFAFAATIVLCLGILILILSASRAQHYNLTHHSSKSHTDESHLPAHHKADYAKKRRKAAIFKNVRKQQELGEMHELQTLEKLGDNEMLVNEQWLPRLKSRQSEAGGKKKKGKRRADSKRRRHTLDLTRNAERISHDTYFLGIHEHPQDSKKQLEGYAFVHYHGHSAKAKQAAQRADEDRAK